MDPAWQSQFRDRMRSFGSMRPPHKGELPVSIKVRVVSGCFHREHSPNAYSLIDRQVASSPEPSAFDLVEHESGPELLVYVAIATAGLTFAGSVIDLLVAILKARSEGIKKGDRPSDPLEIIVRRVGNADSFLEETVIRVGHTESVEHAKIEGPVKKALRRLLKGGKPGDTNRIVKRGGPKKGRG
jgi:hypothetical protein